MTSVRETFQRRYTKEMAILLADELEALPRYEKIGLLFKVMNDLIDDHAQGCVFAQLADSLEKVCKNMTELSTRPVIFQKGQLPKMVMEE